MRAFVEVLGAGSGDAAAGLLLFFDDARYMFECGDGTQRYCTERSVRLGRLRGLFMTSLTAPSIGGLLGMVLTIADSGKERVTVAGPKGLSSIFEVAQECAFCYRPAMETRIVDIAAPAVTENTPHPATHVVCDDENVHIRAVPVPAASTFSDSEGDLYASPHSTLSYVCRLHDIPGKFDPKAALSLGVKQGPDFGRLKRGESIHLETGKVVKPTDVVSPCTPGPIVLVLACPSLRHVSSVVSNPALCPMQLGICSSGGTPAEDAPICVVYHRAPRSVLADREYQDWCVRFGPATSHVTLHSSMAPERIVFAAQAIDLGTLQRLDSRRFRAPWPWKEEVGRNAQLGGDVDAKKCLLESLFSSQHGVGSERWRLGDCGQQYKLAPVASAGFSIDEVPPRLPNVPATSQFSAVKPLQECTVAGNEEDGQVSEPLCVGRFDRQTAEVCFLGTAGAIPGKHRNVSGILLHMFSRGGVLMDCGEGTWGQMTRAYGLEAARALLRSLNIVFISHIHADHHLGLLTLLYEREDALLLSGDLATARNLVVIGPAHISTWLTTYHTAVYGTGSSSRIKFCDAAALTEPQAEESNLFADSFGLDIACVQVIHCPLSYGIIIADRVKGWSVVYSGDTRPCRALAEAGRGATLAIHEATLEDAMVEEAISKRHSTTSEALTVCGEWMGAWRTVLTHFSQRYPRIPLLDEPTMKSLQRNRAAIAFDLMRINFADLAATPHIMPGVRQVFPLEIPVPPVSDDLQVLNTS